MVPLGEFRCETCGIGLPAALHRVSPKGELARWRCSKHHTGRIDHIVSIIEERNKSKLQGDRGDI